jgi:hypothetical protein
MSVEIFTHSSTTAAGVAIRVHNPADDTVFDFADDTWKLVSAPPTTPYLQMTEPAAANLGTGRKLYTASLELARIHRGPSKKEYVFGRYAGTAPALTVNPTALETIVIQAGRNRPDEVSIDAAICCRTTAGFAVQLMARLECDGQPVNPWTCGRAKFTADAGTDVITSAAHGLNDGDVVCFHTYTGTLPGNLTAETAYYVRDKTTDTFKVSTTSGGSAVNISSNGTAPNYWDKPTVTFTVREHTSGIAAFTKTLNASHIKNNRFEGEYPDGTAFTVDAGADTIEAVAHGKSNGNTIVVATGPGGTLPGGLSAATTYYVISATTDDFQVSLTLAGAAVPISSAGTGTFWFIPATALFTGDRLYDVSTSMVLAGETITDSDTVLNLA